jgi:guanylate kinase
MNQQRPQLQRKADFELAIKSFKLSDHAESVLASTPLVAFVGITASGRNTVIRHLVEQGNYRFVVSDTTRQPKFRDGRLEQDGVDYYFRSEEAVLQDIINGEYIEAEIIHNQQVSGSSIRELKKVLEAGKTPIRDFDIGGIENIAKLKPDAIIIALLPPTYAEWERRLYAREHIDSEEFNNRLRTAKRILEMILTQQRFNIVINDDLQECVETIRTIVEHDGYTSELAAYGHHVAQEILDGVNRTLGTH